MANKFRMVNQRPYSKCSDLFYLFIYLFAFFVIHIVRNCTIGTVTKHKIIKSLKFQIKIIRIFLNLSSFSRILNIKLFLNSIPKKQLYNQIVHQGKMQNFFINYLELEDYINENSMFIFQVFYCFFYIITIKSQVSDTLFTKKLAKNNFTMLLNPE